MRHIRDQLLPLFLLAPAALAQAADGGQGPNDKIPVPMYQSNVTGVQPVAPGMAVIKTTDPADKVIGFYKSNLKDQMSDEDTKTGHHHFLTHNGAGVDVATEGQGRDRKTIVRLLWNSRKYGDYKTSGAPAVTETPQPNPPEVAAVTPTPLPPTPQPAAPQLAPVELTSPQLARMQALPLREQMTQAPLAVAAIEPPARKPAEQARPGNPKLAEATKPPIRAELYAPKSRRAAEKSTWESRRHEAVAPEPALDRQPTDDSPGIRDFAEGRYAEALQTWQDEALAGDATAAFYLGMMYETGHGVAQDNGDAFRWFARAGELGNPAGYYQLGVMLDQGIGLSADKAQAAVWYAKAAEAGHGKAAYDLGLMYSAGYGVPQDGAKADAYFRRAGNLAVGGKVNLPDPSPEFEAAGRAAPAHGSRHAAEQVKLFEDGAAEGNPAAEYDLAYCYENGIGVRRDPRQADQFYRLAADGAGTLGLKSAAQAAAEALTGQTD